MPKPKPKTDAADRKGKERAARGSGHFVTVHEPDGGTHAVFLRGPAPQGMSHAGRPKGLATRARNAAHRADFISGGQVTGRQKDHAKAVKEAHRLRTAREAHNEGVKVRRHVAAAGIKGRQEGFRERLAAKAKRAPAKPSLREQVAAHRATKGAVADREYALRGKIYERRSELMARVQMATPATINKLRGQSRANNARENWLNERHKARQAAARPAPVPVHPAAAPYPSGAPPFHPLGRRSAAYGQHSAARTAEKAASLDRASALLREQRAAKAPAGVDLGGKPAAFNTNAHHAPELADRARAIRGAMPADHNAPALATPGLDLKRFAADVHEAARKTPHKVGGKAFVFGVHEEYSRSHPGMTADRFKHALVAANRARHLDLARADLPEAMNPVAVAASEVRNAGSTHHFVRVPGAAAPARPSLREMIQKHRKTT